MKFMPTPSTDVPTTPAVKTELEHVKTQKDVAHAFEDISKMMSQKPDPKHPNADRLKPLESANLKALGLPDGFKVIGFDGQYPNGGAMLVSNDKGKTAHLIDSKGNEFAITGDKKDTVGNQEQASKLPPDIAQLGFGHGRKLDVDDPDGKSGKYKVNAKDNLWQVSADLLGKNTKKLSHQDTLDIEDEIKSIAKANGIKDPNKILTGKELNVAIPEAKQAEAQGAVKAIADKAAADQAEIDKKAAGAPKEAPKETAEEAAARTQKENDAKLALSAFHPDKDTAGLQPVEGVYNPLAPQGLVEDADKLTSRTVQPAQPGDTDADGNTTKVTKGELKDGSSAWLGGWNSTFTSTDKLDSSGALKSRDLTYDTGYGNMKFVDNQGQIVNVPEVQSIHTERQADGTYLSTISSVKHKGVRQDSLTIITDPTPATPTPAPPQG
jgi:hypothetical protein